MVGTAVVNSTDLSAVGPNDQLTGLEGAVNPGMDFFWIKLILL
jgi:hypothetical protein